jgi:hypothetical protein
LTEEMLETEKMSKTLIKILTLYHPDKVPKDDLGWFYFCGEIFRFINHYYSNYKGYN